MVQKIFKPKRTAKSRMAGSQGLAAKLAAVEQSVVKQQIAKFGPGDTVRVHVRIKEGEKERVQIFEGTAIARYGAGANRSFLVRKISHGVGVERIFMERSPKVAKVEVVQPGKVRRAKLYYVRGLEGRAARIKRDLKAESASAASS